MKKCFVMGAMLLAAVSYAADQVIDLSKPEVWAQKAVQAGPAAGTLSVKTNLIINTKAMFPVDDKHTYDFNGVVGAVQKGKIAGNSHIGFFLYDKDKKFIGQINVDTLPGSKTVLVEPIKKGATTFKIKAANWKPAGHHYLGFNVKDSELCRDVAFSSVKKVDKDGANMIITVNRPINKDYAAGTAIAIQKSGSYYYSSFVKPGAKDKAFRHPLKKVNFWKKTAYISPMILVNWGLPAKADKSKLETIYKDMKLTIKEIK